MVPRRTNFGERSEPAPDRGGKLQSAGGRHKVTFRHCTEPHFERASGQNFWGGGAKTYLGPSTQNFGWGPWSPWPSPVHLGGLNKIFGIRDCHQRIRHQILHQNVGLTFIRAQS